MKTFTRTSFVALLCSVLGLAACTGSNGTSVIANPFDPGSTVRFLNGSPDAGGVDVAIGQANNIVFRNVTYGTISLYTKYGTSNSPDIYVYRTGTSTLIGSKQLPDGNTGTAQVVLAAKTRNTLVLAGYAGAPGNAALVKFQEHIFNTGAGLGAVQFHHAATGLQNTTIDVGYYPINSPASRTQLGTVSFGLTPFATEPLPNPPSGSGIGFYMLGGAFTIAPSQVDATDTTNVMPINGATQNNDQNLSIYLIDGPGAFGTASLFGVFDPEN